MLGHVRVGGHILNNFTVSSIAHCRCENICAFEAYPVNVPKRLSRMCLPNERKTIRSVIGKIVRSPKKNYIKAQKKTSSVILSFEPRVH